MLTVEQQQAILSRVSAGRVLALASSLEARDRTVGGHGLDQACERMAAQLHAAGAHQVGLQTYPSGSEHRILGRTLERRPCTEEAELWLRRPDGSETLLCRRSDNPACSMGAFRSTASEGEIFEVVDVGFGTRPTDYRSHRLAGKVALASGHQAHAAMLEALAQRQAEGLLCGPGTANVDPSHVVPHRLVDPSLFGTHRPFGFNLNADQLSQLGNLLAAGLRVSVRARTRVTMGNGNLPVVTAVLEGSDAGEHRVLLVADLSGTAAPLGVACLHEVLRVVAALVADGQLPPPRRTLEILLVPGTHGALAWLDENRAAWDRLRAALYVELPGAEAASRLELQRPPALRPSFVADLVHGHLRRAAEMEAADRGDVPVSLRSISYAGTPLLGAFVDRSVAVPAVGVAGRGRPGSGAGHGPLHRLTAALGWAAVDLCNLDTELDLPTLIASSELNGHRRLGQRAERLADRIRRELVRGPSAASTARHLLWLVETSLAEGLRQEHHVLRSCGDYHDGAGQHALSLAEASSRLERLSSSLVQTLALAICTSVPPAVRLSTRRRRLSALERRAASVVVVRVDGPLAFSDLLREARPADRTWLAHNSGLLATQPVGDLLAQWIDNRRTLLEVWDQLSLDDTEADLKLIWRYLEVLEGAGIVELREVSPFTTAGAAASDNE